MAKYTSNIDYVQYALDVAYDDRYYYAHSSDPFSFSCSTLVAKALYMCGYFKKDVVPADGAAIGGNDSSPLHKALFAAGFKKYAFSDVKMQPGDILTVLPYHVAICVKGNIMVAANGNGDMVDRSPSAITTYDYRLVGTPRWIFRLPESKIHYLKETNTMTKTEKATQQMEAWAKDDSHGYDQQYRWGQKGDYDCSAAVIQAWQNAGVPVKTAGATYTGNIKPIFLANGFSDVTSKVNLSTGSGLVRGDVLLNTQNHVAMYCGNGKEVEASINEFGGVTGGQPGDQTGTEFLIRSYRNYPWDCVLRYKDATTSSTTGKVVYMLEFKKIKYGNKNKYVKAMQAMLRGRGFIDKQKKNKETGDDGSIEVDGKWGDSTQRAWVYFQEKCGLAIKTYCDETRWKKLFYLK